MVREVTLMKKRITIIVTFLFCIVICSCFTLGTVKAQTTTDLSSLFSPFMGGMFGLGGYGGLGMMGMMNPFMYGGLLGS